MSQYVNGQDVNGQNEVFYDNSKKHDQIRELQDQLSSQEDEQSQHYESFFPYGQVQPPTTLTKQQQEQMKKHNEAKNLGVALKNYLMQLEIRNAAIKKFIQKKNHTKKDFLELYEDEWGNALGRIFWNNDVWMMYILKSNKIKNIEVYIEQSRQYRLALDDAYFLRQ